MKMRLPIDPITARGMSTNITHRGAMLQFDISDFNNRQFKGHDASIQINDYWASLSERKNDEIFATYVEIHQLFQRTADIYNTHAYGVTEMITELCPLVTKLVQQHNLENLHRWTSLNTFIYIPNIKDEFVEEDNLLHSRDKTYTKKDYVALCAMVVLLRACIPVCGEFLVQTNELIKQRAIKDLMCMKIFSDSGLESFQAYTKLDDYIRSNIPRDLQNAASLDLSSRDEYPEMVIAHVILRKIIAGWLVQDKRRDNNEKESHLVTNISNAIKGAAGQGGGTLFTQDDVKFIDRSGDQSDDAPSVFEQGRYAMEFGVGDIEIQNYYAHQPEIVLKNIDADVPVDLLHKFIEKNSEIKKRPNFELLEVQKKLVQYVVHKSIDARWIYYINRDAVYNLFSVTQAVLYHWGFTQLCALATAHPSRSSAADNNATTRIRMPQDIMMTLSIIYPYGTPASEKKRGTRASNLTDLESIPPVIADIDWMDAKLSEHAWVSNMPDDLTDKDTPRRISIGSDMKIILARLAIKLHENF